jgi:hypothetical protein
MRVIPPTTSQRHEQCDSILMTLRNSLEIGHGGHMHLHVSGQDIQEVDQAGMVVGLYQMECFTGSAL